MMVDTVGRRLVLAAVLSALALSGCSDPDFDTTSSAASTGIVDDVAGPGEVDPAPQFDVEEVLPFGVDWLLEPWIGDLDGMASRRIVRVLTTYGRGRYYLDGARQSGITFEMFKQFEKQLNESAGRGHLKIHVLFIPVSRDNLIPFLLEGKGDIAAAALTITNARAEEVDFTDPVYRGVNEILVTGPSAPPIDSIADLSGQTIHVRPSSSYRRSLEKLNERFVSEGRAPIELLDASELLEDEEYLEMVSSGLMPWIVVDDYKAELWSDVFGEITLRHDIVFRENASFGWAIRPDSPKLAGALNEFIKSHKQGTLIGNILINRYTDPSLFTHNALASEDYQRLQDLIHIFETYGTEYGFDYVMVAAQGYQESRLDQSARSQAGAVGVMQLLPSTASDPNVGIPDITTAEENIHAGIKYLNFIRNRYFDDDEVNLLNKTAFSLASYNAGPARIRDLRQKAKESGLDPNVWFDNVEVMAARHIGRETVEYVANIYKYYMAYSFSAVTQINRARAARESGLEPQADSQ